MVVLLFIASVVVFILIDIWVTQREKAKEEEKVSELSRF